MGLLYKNLALFLRDYAQSYGRGAFASLAKTAGIHPSVIARTAAEKSIPTLETWEKLHAALPGEIPPPQFEGAAQIMLSAATPRIPANSTPNPFLKPSIRLVGPKNSKFLNQFTEETLSQYRAIPLSSDGLLSPGRGGSGFGNDYPPEAMVLVYEPEIGQTTRSLQAMKVKGDSMEPTIPKGAIVVFDADDKKLLDHKIYVVKKLEAEGLMGTVRRVRVAGSGQGVVLLSDNREYLPEVITDPQWNHLVVGRVIWMWRSLLEA